MKKFLIALGIWCGVLTLGFTIALIFFNNFLKDYQEVYTTTRPSVEMDTQLSMFSAENMNELMNHLTNVDLSTDDLKTQFKTGGEMLFSGKTIAYDILKDEHTEDRPAYVVTCDDEPIAVLRFQKQATAEKYGLPLWEVKGIEWLVSQNEGYTVSAPSGVTLKVNGLTLNEDSAIETGIQHERARYFAGCAEIPSYNKYSIGHIYGEPIIEATNAYGDTLEVTLDEKNKNYVVEFGTSQALLEESGEYMMQFIIDYAQYITNDTSYSYLDHYFPYGSALLQGIKNNPRHYYAEHKTPEIKNAELKELVIYDDDTACAHGYLEQHMLIYYSGKTKVVVTDINVFFFKDGDTWKVSGIAFENMEE